MEALNALLLLLIIACAVAVTFSKSLLSAIIIFMAQSLAMSIVWMLLQSPDLAITEAAVGAGVTTILMFAALKRIHGIEVKKHDGSKDEKEV